MRNGTMGREVRNMAMVTVRNLDEQVKARLRERAARRGRSMEAEIREILADAVRDDLPEPSLAEVFLAGFGAHAVDLDLPDRSAEQHRVVDL